MEIITKQAVRENQLFLKTAIQFGVTELLPLYDWFENKLVIITPHSAYTALNKFADSNDELNSQMLDLVRKFGTGIDHLSLGQSKIQLLKSSLRYLGASRY